MAGNWPLSPRGTREERRFAIRVICPVCRRFSSQENQTNGTFLRPTCQLGKRAFKRVPAQTGKKPNFRLEHDKLGMMLEPTEAPITKIK